MTTYNGWTNYETWNVNLWLDNEPGSSEDKRDIIGGSKTKYEAEKSLRDYVCDPANGLIPDLPASMAADLLGAALDSVNWAEIVESEWDELHEDEEDDSDDEDEDEDDEETTV